MKYKNTIGILVLLIFIFCLVGAGQIGYKIGLNKRTEKQIVIIPTVIKLETPTPTLETQTTPLLETVMVTTEVEPVTTTPSSILETATLSPPKNTDPPPIEHEVNQIKPSGLLFYTHYSDRSKWGRTCANPAAEKRGLISINEDLLYDDVLEVYLHSCAADNSKIPFGTIFYIEELNKYFIVDDNTSTEALKKLHDRAGAWGAEFWIDIFISTEDEQDPTYSDLIYHGIGTFSYQVIRWGY